MLHLDNWTTWSEVFVWNSHGPDKSCVFVMAQRCDFLLCVGDLLLFHLPTEECSGSFKTGIVAAYRKGKLKKTATLELFHFREQGFLVLLQVIAGTEVCPGWGQDVWLSYSPFVLFQIMPLTPALSTTQSCFLVIYCYKDQQKKY